jgi:AcrR family transcriptional regulator
MSRTRRRLPPDERRALIEEQAARLFAEHGYAATRLDEIAAAANVTKPVLYRHFDSKQALYLALLRKHAEQLPRFVDPTVGEAPLAERLPTILDGWFAYVEQHPYAWQMIFRDTTGDEEIQAARRLVQERARTVLADLLHRQPELAIPKPELEPTAELLRTAMAGLALWWQDHPDTPRSVLVELVTRMIRGVLQPAQDGGRHLSGGLTARPPPRSAVHARRRG